MYQLKDLEELNYCNGARKVLFDSRGVKLSVGDRVCYFSSTISYGKEIQLGTVQKNQREGLTVAFMDEFCYFRASCKAYMIKVKDFDESFYKLKHLKLCTEASGVGITKVMALSNLKEANDTIEILHRLAGNKDIRNLTMRDMLGRELHIGDYVYYMNKDGNVGCGIVLSNRQVLNNEYVKETVKHVLLVTKKDMIDFDYENYAELTAFYNNQLSHLKTDSKDLETGAVYVDKNNCYIYLGKIDMSWSIQQGEKTTTKVSYLPDNKKAYWLIFDKKANYINKQRDIGYILMSALTHSKKYDISYTEVENGLLGMYFNIIDFDCLVNEIPNKVNYLTHLNIEKNVLVIKDFTMEKKGLDKCNLKQYQCMLRFK